jgi:hypothetical protein
MADVSIDHSKLDVRLGKLEPQMRDALVVVVRRDADELRAEMRSLASGDLVQVRTGKFVKSFRRRVRKSKNRVKATVGTKSPLAHILEGGASIPPHLIAPKNAHALLLRARTGEIFAAKVQSPGGKIAARPIVETAFNDMKGQIESDLISAGKSAAREI